MGSTLGRGPTKLTMGGSRDSCKGTRYSAIQHICMQSEAYKTCEGWATGDSDAAIRLQSCSYSNKCDNKEWVLTNSLLFNWLRHCAALRTFEDGRLVHRQLVQTRCEFDVFLRSSLVDMYAKCGSIEDAWRLFNKMPSQIVVTGAPWYWHIWNVGRRHLDYFNKCNRKVCSQTLLLSWGCWKHVPAWLQLKRVGVFIGTSFKAVWNLMSLWGVA